MERSLISKKELRREILARRDAMTKEERYRGSLLLTERILGHQWFYCSEILLGFVNYGSEISTVDILEEALKVGKKVYVPKIVETDMRFYRIESLVDLKEGYKGILEPDCSGEEFVYTPNIAEKTLMLMPGVAFDMFRNRMGYGKGFYDRYLMGKDALQLRTIAVGFQCQMADVIPAEENDIKPYQVIVV